MRLSSLKSVGTLVALTLALTVTSARADDFTFSFTNTIGDASGTVTGIIYGLTNNSTGAASDVVITSFRLVSTPSIPPDPSMQAPGAANTKTASPKPPA